MNASRRSLCIVSRDPLQCSELVLSLQSSLNPDDEVEIVMDRRRARDVFDTKSGAQPVSVERRHNPEIDLAVRTKGFAIVPAVPMTSRPREEADAEERARFDNILSFKRRHESRSGRVVGAAGAVMVALILAPTPSGFFGRVLRDAPSSAAPAPRLDPADPSVAPPGASELVPPASHVPSGGPATLTRPRERRDRNLRGARRGRDRTRRLESQGSDRSRHERSDRQRPDEWRPRATGT